jgi:adenylosuccinate synthase
MSSRKLKLLSATKLTDNYFQHFQVHNSSDDNAPYVVVLIAFAADTSLLSRVEPEYKVFPGWSSSTTKCTSYDQLSREARDYVEFIEDFIGVRIDSIGIGPDREDLLRR